MLALLQTGRVEKEQKKKDPFLSGEDVQKLETQQKNTMEGIIGKRVVFFVNKDKYTGTIMDKVRVTSGYTATNYDNYVVADESEKIHIVKPFEIYKLTK